MLDSYQEHYVNFAMKQGTHCISRGVGPLILKPDWDVYSGQQASWSPTVMVPTAYTDTVHQYMKYILLLICP